MVEVVAQNAHAEIVVVVAYAHVLEEGPPDSIHPQHLLPELDDDTHCVLSHQQDYLPPAFCELHQSKHEIDNQYTALDLSDVEGQVVHYVRVPP
jgi:hypothetical protein